MSIVATSFNSSFNKFSESIAKIADDNKNDGTIIINKKNNFFFSSKWI